MSEPDEIPRARSGAARSAPTRSARGRRVLVTAGGTREPLDAVRFLGNRSSGRMGVALAAEARRRGAEVTLLAANLSVPAPARRRGRRDADRRRPRARGAGRARSSDLVLMAAAVADYRPAEPIDGKRPKDRRRLAARARADRGRPRRSSARSSATARCSSASAPRRARPASTRKREMLTDKNVDLVVFNDVSDPTSASTPPTTR